MKRLFINVFFISCAFWSLISFADGVATVDMQQIFQSSPQVKKINDSLTKQFATRRDSIVTMGKALQEKMQKFQKNKTVMSSKEVTAMKNQITSDENKLRQDQTKFQQDLFQAQNEQMNHFMDKVKDTVKTIAAEKKMNIVIAKNSVLYSESNNDITSELLSKLK